MAKHYSKHESPKKKGGFFKGLLKFIGILILIVVIVVAGVLIFLTATEYKPADSVSVGVTGLPETSLSTGDSLKVMTWNIGYGALGDNADFFMDGGEMVNTATEDRVNENLEGITSELDEETPDIVMMQEVDQDSARSHNINELQTLQLSMPEYASSFANNFKVAFIPYPIPPIGKVDSGIATFSAYPLESSVRVQLPNPFSWPIRMANLKRCVMVSRIQLEDSDKQLVIMNLHLEAYDDGEGKAAQTEMLAELLQAEADKGNYVIAGGDFNQIFSSEDATIYPAQEGKWTPGTIDVDSFGEGWQFLMDETSPTCRSLDQPYASYVGSDNKQDDDFQYYLIDGFIVSENITVDSYETKDLDFVNSDHNPVFMNITLEK